MQLAKVFYIPKIKFLSQVFPKLEHKQDRQTHKQTYGQAQMQTNAIKHNTTGAFTGGENSSITLELTLAYMETGC